MEPQDSHLGGDNFRDEIAEKIKEYCIEFTDFEEKVGDLIHEEPVKHFLFRIYIIFYYCMKALDAKKAREFYNSKLGKFQHDGQYFLRENEKILKYITEAEDNLLDNNVPWPTDFYDSIYEEKVC